MSDDPLDLIAQEEAEDSQRIYEAAKQKPSMLEAALWIAKHLGPVIPTAPYGTTDGKGKPSKEPCGQLVPHGSKDATTDEATIRRWWTQVPNANIGLVGASANPPIFVVDIDVKGGVDGFAALRKAGRELPATLEQRTATGGRHYFYKWTQGEKPKQTQGNIRDDNDVKIEGVDVRGVNGYVVVAPSRTTAGEYTWLSKRFDDLAEFPEWAKRVGSQKPKMKVVQEELPRQNNKQRNGEKPSSDDKVRRASAYLAKVKPAIQGRDGHGSLLHAAEVLVIGFDLDDATAADILWREYNPRCVPPWKQGDAMERAEFERKISEARKHTDNVVGYLLNASPTQDDEPDEPDENVDEQLDWQKMIDDLPGLVGDIARYALSAMIRPQPKFAVLIALVTVATIYNRTIHDQAHNLAHIFAFAVCPNGGGKDIVLKIPAAIIEAALSRLDLHTRLVMSKAHSESAIADELAHGPVKTMLIDEVAGFFKQAKAAEKSGASISTVKGVLKTLYSFALDEVYEGAKNARVQGKSQKRIRVNTPCVSFVGVTQDDVLPDAFQEEDVRDGLLPRNIFFITDTRPRKNYEVLAHRPPVPEEIITTAAGVFKAQRWRFVDPANPTFVTYDDEFQSFELKATDEALAMQRQFGEQCDDNFETLDMAGKLTSSIWVRADENARRVALVIAAGRHGADLMNATIEKRDVELATMIIRACANDACRFLEGRIMDDRFDKLKVKLRRFIAKAGSKGRTLTEIARGKFGEPKIRQLALTDEISSGYVRCESKAPNGRSIDVFFITRRGNTTL